GVESFPQKTVDEPGPTHKRAQVTISASRDIPTAMCPEFASFSRRTTSGRLLALAAEQPLLSGWQRCQDQENQVKWMPFIRRLLLVGHTHHGVGYTLSPRLVDGLHMEIVGRVLDLCDASDAAVPPDAPDAFRWTFEVARPVHRFLQEASDTDVERLRQRV